MILNFILKLARSVQCAKNRAAFHQRILAHVPEAQHASKGPLWCITHQAVIEEVTKHFGVKIPGALTFLDYVVMLS